MARKTDTPPTVDSRTQPHNLDAERAVLGTFFLRETALTEVQALLSPEDFDDSRHQEIFALLVNLQEKGEPIDHSVGVVVHHELGDLVQQGTPLFTVHANDQETLGAARERVVHRSGAPRAPTAARGHGTPTSRDPVPSALAAVEEREHLLTGDVTAEEARRERGLLLATLVDVLDEVGVEQPLGLGAVVRGEDAGAGLVDD